LLAQNRAAIAIAAAMQITTITATLAMLASMNMPVHCSKKLCVKHLPVIEPIRFGYV
jgi:hypothetical protein